MCSVILPQDWKDGNITPLHKKVCSNYHPVTRSSQIVKLLERLIQDQILAHVKKYNIKSCDQHGFQEKCSCISQLLECLNDWTRPYDSSNPVDIVYLDFAKAFDSRVPETLIQTGLLRY